MSTYLDPKQITDLVELAKLGGSEYMLIDNGSTTLKVSVETLLGYMGSKILDTVKPISLACPVGTVIGCTSAEKETAMKNCFGGVWSQIGITTIDGTTVYQYSKISGDDSASSPTYSSSVSGSMVIIPEGEELPAESRTEGTIYLNVMTTVNAHLNNGLPNGVTVSPYMGLKILE